MPEHRDLTGADLHEPKGVASASSGTAYFANGTGSGSWRKVDKTDLNNTNLFPNLYTLEVVLADISTAETVLVAVPYSSTLVKVVGLLGGAITDANSSVTILQNGGSTINTITVSYTGSAKGVSTVVSPTSNNTFSEGGYVEISTNGASTGATPYYLTLVFERTS